MYWIQIQINTNPLLESWKLKGAISGKFCQRCCAQYSTVSTNNKKQFEVLWSSYIEVNIEKQGLLTSFLPTSSSASVLSNPVGIDVELCFWITCVFNYFLLLTTFFLLFHHFTVSVSSHFITELYFIISLLMISSFHNLVIFQFDDAILWKTFAMFILYRLQGHFS